MRAERLCQQQQAPPDMMTGQSIRTCLRREVPTDHEAHSHTYALSNRVSAGLQPGGRNGNTTIQSRRVHDRGKPSRAKPDERCRTPFAIQTFEAKTPTTRRSQRRAKWTTRCTAESTTMPTTRSEQSSGIIFLHAQCLMGGESSSEWGWGLRDHT